MFQIFQLYNKELVNYGIVTYRPTDLGPNKCSTYV
jgi:hypothetical protein